MRRPGVARADLAARRATPTGLVVPLPHDEPYRVPPPPPDTATRIRVAIGIALVILAMVLALM